MHPNHNSDMDNVIDSQWDNIVKSAGRSSVRSANQQPINDGDVEAILNRLHALDNTPAPSHSFLHHLDDQLKSASADLGRTKQASITNYMSGLSPTESLRSKEPWDGPKSLERVSLRSRVTDLALAAIVLLLVVTTIRLNGRDDEAGPRSGETTGAAIGTPDPSVSSDPLLLTSI